MRLYFLESSLWWMVCIHYHEMARKNMMKFCCNHLRPFLRTNLWRSYSAVKVLVVETPVNSSVELGADFSCKAQCLSVNRK